MPSAPGALPTTWSNTMSLIDGLSAGLLLLGAGFFVVGTLGLLRFPDLYTRLHALSKVDNLGLGFTVLGLMLQASDLREVLKLLLVWLLALVITSYSIHYTKLYDVCDLSLSACHETCSVSFPLTRVARTR